MFHTKRDERVSTCCVSAVSPPSEEQAGLESLTSHSGAAEWNKQLSVSQAATPRRFEALQYHQRQTVSYRLGWTPPPPPPPGARWACKLLLLTWQTYISCGDFITCMRPEMYEVVKGGGGERAVRWKINVAVERCSFVFILAAKRKKSYLIQVYLRLNSFISNEEVW